MGTRFVRVAVAGEPPAITEFAPRPALPDASCCVECGRPHPPNVDEYYFWLMDSRHFTEQEQDAAWGTSTDAEAEDVDNFLSDWHRPEQRPGLLHWASEPMVHLAWCRVHNGEFQQPRRSHEGVRINDGAVAAGTPQLRYLGRAADSLYFEVDGGQAPIGFPAPPAPDEPEPAVDAPGFRYDMAPDAAVVLPEIALAEPENGFAGGLPAYPYMAFFEPGAPLFPASLFSPVLAVAAQSESYRRWQSRRRHCRPAN